MPRATGRRAAPPTSAGCGSRGGRGCPIVALSRHPPAALGLMRRGVPSRNSICALPIPLREQGACHSRAAPGGGPNRPFGRTQDGLPRKWPKLAYFLCTDWPRSASDPLLPGHFTIVVIFQFINYRRRASRRGVRRRPTARQVLLDLVSRGPWGTIGGRGALAWPLQNQRRTRSAGPQSEGSDENRAASNISRPPRCRRRAPRGRTCPWSVA